MYEQFAGHVRPRLLAGHEPRGPGEIVLAHTLLEALGRSVGDEITAASSAGRVVMRIVGSAVLWSVPYGSTSPGDGALVTGEGLARLPADRHGTVGQPAHRLHGGVIDPIDANQAPLGNVS